MRKVFFISIVFFCACVASFKTHAQTSKYSLPQQYSPYVSPYNLDLIKEAFIYKQAQYEREREAWNLIVEAGIEKNREIQRLPSDKKGVVCFFTDDKKALKSGSIYLFIDGYYLGQIDAYFKTKDIKKSRPSCENSGTTTIWYMNGTYNFEAISSTSRWRGTVTFTPNSPTTKWLSK